MLKAGQLGTIVPVKIPIIQKPMPPMSSILNPNPIPFLIGEGVKLVFVDIKTRKVYVKETSKQLIYGFDFFPVAFSALKKSGGDSLVDKITVACIDAGRDTEGWAPYCDGKRTWIMILPYEMSKECQ